MRVPLAPCRCDPDRNLTRAPHPKRGQSMTGTGNNRRYSRVNWHSQAVVTAGGSDALGPVLDISLNGVLVGTDPGQGPGAPCDVRIQLGDDPEQSIAASGEVVRRDAQGVAVRFETMDLDSAAHLRRLVTLNSEDPGRAEREAAHLRLPPHGPPPEGSD